MGWSMGALSPVAWVEAARGATQPATAVEFHHGNRWNPPLLSDLDPGQDALLHPLPHPAPRHLEPPPRFLGREQLQPQ